jgi:hypothetical protein
MEVPVICPNQDEGAPDPSLLGTGASRITVIRFSTNYPEPQCLFPAFHTRDSGHIRRAAAMLLYLCSWRNSGLGVKTEKRNSSVFLIFFIFLRFPQIS